MIAGGAVRVGSIFSEASPMQIALGLVLLPAISSVKSPDFEDRRFY